MAVFVPNVGEKEMLQDILRSQAFRCGIYCTHVIPDGSTIFSTLTELDAEAGGYQTKDFEDQVVVDAETADCWYVYTNDDGKAEAQYGLAASPQEWVFVAADVANAATAYGIFAWTLTIEVTSGGTDVIQVGDTITGLVGGATAEVTSVRLRSGTFAGGDAVLTLCLKGQTGTFEAEGIKVDVADCGTIAGDSDKALLYTEAFSSGEAIDTVGQKIAYLPKITLSTS